MPLVIELDKEQQENLAVLKVVGVGGGGCNAVESMIKRGLSGVEYIAINTDAQVLKKNMAHHKIQIGSNITRGLGAGADPRVGRKAAEEDREKITKVLEGSDMVFVTSGMGGGTGTGAAPLVASIAKSLGALVVGIVTKPFRWEGKKRMINAEAGIHELRQYVDSLIAIPNERLLGILDSPVSAGIAFDKPNEVLYEATRGIADIITIEGIINVDFADVRTVMSQSGDALMGCGIASGEKRAIEAAQKAISSPLLEGINIKGAKNILLNVTSSSDLTMQEIDEGNQVIYEAAGEEANVIFGWVRKEDMNDYVSYTVIATGFDSKQKSSSTHSFNKSDETVVESKPREIFSGGFSISNDLPIDQNDLDTPTFIRVNGNRNFLNQVENIEKPGLNIRDIKTIKEDNPKSRDNDDSSSFLRMMMD